MKCDILSGVGQEEPRNGSYDWGHCNWFARAEWWHWIWIVTTVGWRPLPVLQYNNKGKNFYSTGIWPVHSLRCLLLIKCFHKKFSFNQCFEGYKYTSWTDDCTSTGYDQKSMHTFLKKSWYNKTSGNTDQYWYQRFCCKITFLHINH